MKVRGSSALSASVGRLLLCGNKSIILILIIIILILTLIIILFIIIIMIIISLIIQFHLAFLSFPECTVTATPRSQRCLT